MIRSLIFAIFTLMIILASCSKSEKDLPELKKHFEAAGYSGSFAMYDNTRKQWVYYNKDKCFERMSPASTFKIVNSLIALETGVMKDIDDTLRWDGYEREVAAWNQDQNMTTAFKYSVVWFYREIARRIGADSMQHYIKLIDGYGDMSSAGNIDKFWLDGSFEVSQVEQVNMLRRLYADDLPFSERTMNLVKKLMLYENTPTYTIRAKTGADRVGMTGWFVGWVEEKGAAYFFATNLKADSLDSTFMQARIDVTKNILKNLSLLRE